MVALACYVAARRLEAFDQRILAAGGNSRGHALEHLAAAAGTYRVLRAIRRDRHLPVAMSAGHGPEGRTAQAG